MVSGAVIERGQKLVKTLGIVLEEHLGTGNFGIVYRGIDSEGKLVAVKFVEKTQYVSYLDREVKIQCSLNHENLVRLYQFIDDPIMVVMVMEYCDCTLTEYLSKQNNKCIPEPQFRAFARQLMAGLQALHQAGIAHRDLKPDNVLMRKGPGDHWTLKLADFGFAKEEMNLLKTQLGSPIYTAPEVSSGLYHAECDLWSIGTVMYEMLVGRRLFPVKTKAELDCEIKGPTEFYTLPPGFPASSLCQSFIKGLLYKNPKKRFTFEQAFTHPFVMPKLVLYHFGKPTQMDLTVVDDNIELGDLSQSCGGTIHWGDVVKISMTNNPDLFSSNAPEDAVILGQSGSICDPKAVIRTNTLTNGFHDIIAFCLPTRNSIPRVEQQVESCGWNTVFPQESKRRALERKLHSTAPNSVESMNVRFEEIQMLLYACNQCAIQINKYSSQQQTLCQMQSMFFSEWKPIVETLVALQRAVSAKFTEYVKKSKAREALSFQLVTIIPGHHPDIPTISTFLQQSPEVSRLVVEGKQLRNDTQKLYDVGTRNFVSEARRAVGIVDAAKAHLEQFYQKLSSALANVNKEWNYTAQQGILFSRMVMYIRKLREMDAFLSDQCTAAPGSQANATLVRFIDDLKAIAAGCPSFHSVSKRSQPAPASSADPRPTRTRSGASGLLSENSALKLQNEQLRSELEEARKEIARLNDIIASMKR